MKGKRTKSSQRRAQRAAQQRRVYEFVRHGDTDSLRRASSIVANNPGIRWPTPDELQRR